MSRTTSLWQGIVRGAKGVGATLWEFGVDVYNAVRHGDLDMQGSGRS